MRYIFSEFSRPPFACTRSIEKYNELSTEKILSATHTHTHTHTQTAKMYINTNAELESYYIQERNALRTNNKI